MAVEFRVINQQHEWTFDSNGNRQGQWTVTFETADGVQSQIIVGDESYHPEIVAGLIATEVRVIDDVQKLTHGDETPKRPVHAAHRAPHHAA